MRRVRKNVGVASVDARFPFVMSIDKCLQVDQLFGLHFERHHGFRICAGVVAELFDQQGGDGRIFEKFVNVHGLNLAKRSEEHTSELTSLMRISYAVFCLTKKNTQEP